MTGGVNEIEFVLLAILSLIEHPHRRSLDGNPFLALQIHLIQDLIGHLTGRDGTGVFQQTVRQGGLAVIYVGYDAEIPDMVLIHWRVILGSRGLRQCLWLRLR